MKNTAIYGFDTSADPLKLQVLQIKDLINSFFNVQLKEKVDK